VIENCATTRIFLDLLPLCPEKCKSLITIAGFTLDKMKAGYKPDKIPVHTRIIKNKSHRIGSVKSNLISESKEWLITGRINSINSTDK
jgi:hypothetical protein